MYNQPLCNVMSVEVEDLNMSCQDTVLLCHVSVYSLGNVNVKHGLRVMERFCKPRQRTSTCQPFWVISLEIRPRIYCGSV